MSKQTTTEWLIAQIKNDHTQKVLTGLEWMKIFDQAKTMERDQMLELISFVRVHNKMGKTAEDLLQQFEAYKGGSNE